VPFIGRELTSPLELDGHTLPPGIFVYIWLFGLHHNPAVWGEDHNEYKLDRFHPDSMDKMDSHAFTPFSAGSRNCIGQNFALQELKIVLARVLHHFEVSVDESHNVERVPENVNRAKNGIKLFFKPLHN
jgi:cytochrome P450 family 4 subfamily B polypeptide 1/leukotriene-B4 20-monooxygenase/phylloquinone omega-hydroxylase